MVASSLTHLRAEYIANRKTIIDRSDAAARAAKSGYWHAVMEEATFIRNLAERQITIDLAEEAEKKR